MGRKDLFFRRSRFLCNINFKLKCWELDKEDGKLIFVSKFLIVVVGNGNRCLGRKKLLEFIEEFRKKVGIIFFLLWGVEKVLSFYVVIE